VSSLRTIGAVTLRPHERSSIVADLPPAAAIAVQVVGADGRPSAALGCAAFAARRKVTVTKVAMLGADDWSLGHFVHVHPGLELIGSPDQSDIVIANGEAAPAGKPALVINPRQLPAGWSPGETFANVQLSDCDIVADDPLMAHVNFSSVAVRRLATWKSDGEPADKVLASYKGQPIILRAPPDAQGPARVYVTFDIGKSNTFLSMSPSFVVLLANAVAYLSPRGTLRTLYEFQSPQSSAVGASRRPMEGLSASVSATGPLPWPGIYRDQSGQLDAVTVTALSVGDASPNTDVSQLPLPPPQPAQQALELWQALAMAAMAFWLAGWTLRIK